MLIRGLTGLLTGEGFVLRDGRRVSTDDCGFVGGPVDIAIDGGVVRQIGKNLDASDPVIDGRGRLALPGFIDPHTHAIFAGDRSAEYFMRWAGRSYVEIAQAGGGIHSTVRATREADDSTLRDGLIRVLRAMGACGATVIEVKSGYADCAEGELRLLRLVRDATATSDTSGRRLPRVRASFLGLHALPPGRDEASYVDEMIAAVPRVVSEELACHADSFPERGFFSLEGALRFSTAAARAGLAVKVHADELCDLGSSVAFARAGALSVDHLQHISDEAVALLAECPTVATMLPATSFFVGLPFAGARRLVDAGARVALATDFNPGTAPAVDLQLTHLLAAGQMRLSPAEILCASTFNAAAALGLAPTHGALLPGRSADVLLYAAPEAYSPEAALATWASIILARRRPDAVVAQGCEIAGSRDDVAALRRFLTP